MKWSLYSVHSPQECSSHTVFKTLCLNSDTIFGGFFFFWLSTPWNLNEAMPMRLKCTMSASIHWVYMNIRWIIQHGCLLCMAASGNGSLVFIDDVTADRRSVINGEMSRSILTLHVQTKTVSRSWPDKSVIDLCFTHCRRDYKAPNSDRNVITGLTEHEQGKIPNNPREDSLKLPCLHYSTIVSILFSFF